MAWNTAGAGPHPASPQFHSLIPCKQPPPTRCTGRLLVAQPLHTRSHCLHAAAQLLFLGRSLRAPRGQGLRSLVSRGRVHGCTLLQVLHLQAGAHAHTRTL